MPVINGNKYFHISCDFQILAFSKLKEYLIDLSIDRLFKICDTMSCDFLANDSGV